MSIYNKYVIFLVSTACGINVLLAFLGQNDLSLYFALNVVAFLVITLLYVYMNPRARTALNAIGTVFFAAFMVIVVIKVAEILIAR